MTKILRPGSNRGVRAPPGRAGPRQDGYTGRKEARSGPGSRVRTGGRPEPRTGQNLGRAGTEDGPEPQARSGLRALGVRGGGVQPGKVGVVGGQVLVVVDSALGYWPPRRLRVPRGS